MFDNLRDSAESSFYEEEPNDLYKEPVAAGPAPQTPQLLPEQWTLSSV